MARPGSMDGVRTVAELLLDSQVVVPAPVARSLSPFGATLRSAGPDASILPRVRRPTVRVAPSINAMDSPIGSQPSFTFGPYEADLPSGELRKNGTRIKIQDLPLRLMSVLAENPGQVVTREELQKRLWPDDTFVNFEDGLNTAVRKLREALCDDAEKPRYIETVPRRGYRFIAPVEIRNGGNGTAAPQKGLTVSMPASADETASYSSAAPAVLRRRVSDR